MSHPNNCRSEPTSTNDSPSGGPWEMWFNDHYNRAKLHVQALRRRELRPPSLGSTDLLHEVAARMLKTYEAPPFSNEGEFHALLNKIYNHVLADRAKSRKTIKRGGGKRPQRLDENADAPLVDSVESNVIESVRIEMEKLTDQQSEILVLRVGHGLSTNEIAKGMGISDDTVRRRLAEAETLLRARLG